MKKSLLVLLALCIAAFAQSSKNTAVKSFTDNKTGKKYRIIDNEGQSWFMQDLGNYAWDAAMKACPSGWRLPNDEDWKSLEGFLAMYPELREEFRKSAKIKEEALPDEGINASNGYWWSATEAEEIPDGAYFQFMYHGYNDMYKGYDPKNVSRAVRCVRP
ncbi:MAG: hypothetical protein LBQ87_05375 [Candidatus Fibromonas sp.]|jgi:hypothetical protein|nr:hypothetical protein [Candidatus Fibromonas sp.]